MTSRGVLLQRLGKAVRARRIALGITQEELGSRASIDRTYVSGVERGVRNPSFTALASLARGLGIPLAALLQDVSEPMDLTDG